MTKLRKHRVTMAEKDAYRNSKLQLQNHFSTFILKNKSHSATSILSRQPKAVFYNSTASLDTLIWVDIWSLVNYKTDFDNFSGSKTSQLVGCEYQSSYKRWRQKFLPVIKSNNMRSRLKTIHMSTKPAIEETKACLQYRLQQLSRLWNNN